MSDLLSRMIARSAQALSPVEPMLTPWIPLPPMQDSAPGTEPSSVDATASEPAELPEIEHSRRKDRSELSKMPRFEEKETLPERPSQRPIRVATPHEVAAEIGPLDLEEHVTQAAIAPSRRSKPQAIPQVEPETELDFDSAPVTHAVGSRPATAGAFATPQSRERIQTSMQHHPGAVDVHVTIGHIEVRSSPPPAKAAVQRTEPKHVSLNEYLQRNRGSR